MPQFDFATYPSQIFWFLLCFIALYFYISRIIIPRVKDIIANRKTVIDTDLSSFEEFDKQIKSIEEESGKITADAEIQYKDLIAKAASDAKKEKEMQIEKFKEDSEKLIEKSRSDVKKLVAKSEEKIEKVVSEISEVIEGKLFGLK